jgi:hypothetical protein
VVLEVIREAHFLGLRVDQFCEACKVHGKLDDFLVSWASGLDDNYIRLRDFKFGCLKRALKALPSLRSLFYNTFSQTRAFSTLTAQVSCLIRNAAVPSTDHIPVAKAVRAAIIEADELEKTRLERKTKKEEIEGDEKEASVAKTGKRKRDGDHGPEEAKQAKKAKKSL